MDPDHADEAAHAVFSLFSHDLWLELWPSLDASTKHALRGVCSAMRRQVDGSIEVLASPSSGFSAADLTAALLRSPAVRDLTLLDVSDVAATLQPLTTATLTRLTRLTVREVRQRARAHEACTSLCMCAEARGDAMPGCLLVAGQTPLA
jgi:hypothetical protein